MQDDTINPNSSPFGGMLILNAPDLSHLVSLDNDDADSDTDSGGYTELSIGATNEGANTTENGASTNFSAILNKTPPKPLQSAQEKAIPKDTYITGVSDYSESKSNTFPGHVGDSESSPANDAPLSPSGSSTNGANDNFLDLDLGDLNDELEQTFGRQPSPADLPASTTDRDGTEQEPLHIDGYAPADGNQGSQLDEEIRAKPSLTLSAIEDRYRALLLSQSVDFDTWPDRIYLPVNAVIARAACNNYPDYVHFDEEQEGYFVSKDDFTAQSLMARLLPIKHQLQVPDYSKQYLPVPSSALDPFKHLDDPMTLKDGASALRFLREDQAQMVITLTQNHFGCRCYFCGEKTLHHQKTDQGNNIRIYKSPDVVSMWKLIPPQSYLQDDLSYQVEFKLGDVRDHHDYSDCLVGDDINLSDIGIMSLSELTTVCKVCLPMFKIVLALRRGQAQNLHRAVVQTFRMSDASALATIKEKMEYHDEFKMYRWQIDLGSYFQSRGLNAVLAERFESVRSHFYLNYPSRKK